MSDFMRAQPRSRGGERLRTGSTKRHVMSSLVIDPSPWLTSKLRQLWKPRRVQPVV